MTRLTKLTCLKGLCLFIGLLICASSFGTGRPRVPKTNWENSMGKVAGPGMCVEILPDNILRINFSVGVAVPNIEDYPPLLIEYNWGGYEVGTWGPIMNSDLIPTDIGGLPGYEVEYTVVIDLGDLCPNHSGATTPFSYSFDLVTSTGVAGNSNTLYPVLDYPDVFPLEMFEELDDPDFTPEYAGDKELCCVDMADGRTEDFSGDADAFESVSNNDELSVDLFPNPAKDVLNIRLQFEKESKCQIDLFDINGRHIKSTSRRINLNGNHIEQIDISGIPKGVYFCRVSSEGISKTQKVIKI